MHQLAKFAAGHVQVALRHSKAALQAPIGTRLRAIPRGFPSHSQNPSIQASNRRSCVRAMAAVASEVAEAAVDVKEAPQVKYRKDYQPTPYLVETLDLDFNITEEVTHVTARMRVKPNYPANSPPPAMVLNGREDVKLTSITVNGAVTNNYQLSKKLLSVDGCPPGEFDVEIKTEIKPQENTLLEGLYKSGGNFSTQCEAEGFRGITFFYDRPDVMARYTTRIEADKATCPVLLSNGNLTDSGDLGNGRHYAVWVDPFPKPSYLFALVAGDLQKKERTFTTMSGREVALRIYVQEKNLDKVDWALESLIKSMKWDEDTFGLEYDLDLFNIVAVDDFNMGAMENKSLNIFNSKLVLATPQTATDGDFSRIEAVVGHEYFHNWTGNRVTCRDWFQLTLKEGLTVFRDGEFTSDINSRPVKRIEDVMMLRASQFAEDSGPMAHPIRPESYIKMDNFYTLTVYEKGSEVVRLYRTLLGKEGFRKGMDLYFKRHDGQAVTCDDFLAAMADANGVDLSGLAKWYSQAGTPQLHVRCEYNAGAQTFTIHTKQHTPPTAGQPTKDPVLIPLAVGLLGPDGHDLPLTLQGSSEELGTTAVLRCDKESNTFVFTNVATEPVPSLLRDFSAPVKLTVEGQTDEHLTLLFAHDSDPFNRWDAGQRLAKKLLLKLYEAAQNPALGAGVDERCIAAGGVSDDLVQAYRAILTDESLDGMFLSMATTMPSSAELIDSLTNADPVACYNVRLFVVKQLAARLRPELEALIKKNDTKPGEVFNPDAHGAARRAIKNKALGMLAMLGDPAVTEDCLRRFRGATNMTDSIGALSALVDIPGPAREAALAEFYEQWKDDQLVVLKWIMLAAGANMPGNVKLVTALLDHPAFAITNPNSCYSLFLGFVRSPINFHAMDGSGYAFMGDNVLRLDKVNRQVAARIVTVFTQWRQFDAERQSMMKAQLQRIVATEGLSENVFEIASKSLEEAAA